MAKLHFKYGAMNSGKSDTLIKTAYNYEERGLKVLVIKPGIDTKGDINVVARGGHSRKADILADEDMDLSKEIRQHKNIACVLVDEAQFLTQDHVDQLLLIAKQDDISVICYGLRTDFRNRLFPGSQRILEVADNIEKLPSMCMCGVQAEFNIRRVKGEYVSVGEQVVIDDGSKVTYDSLCGRCYLRESGKI